MDSTTQCNVTPKPIIICQFGIGKKDSEKTTRVRDPPNKKNQKWMAKSFAGGVRLNIITHYDFTRSFIFIFKGI